MSASTQEVIPPVTLGWRLRMSMEWAGVKRSELASYIGVDETTITRWTHDKGKAPRRANLLAWSHLTGVPVKWLETGHAPDGDTTPPDDGQAVGGSALADLTEAKRARSRRGGTTDRYLTRAA